MAGAIMNKVLDFLGVESNTEEEYIENENENVYEYSYDKEIEEETEEKGFFGKSLNLWCLISPLSTRASISRASNIDITKMLISRGISRGYIASVEPIAESSTRSRASTSFSSPTPAPNSSARPYFRSLKQQVSAFRATEIEATCNAFAMPACLSPDNHRPVRGRHQS